MTLSSTTSRQTYAGDGATASFPIPYLFLANDHIEAVLRDSAGAETPWLENTHYTLAGAGAQAGGTLTVSTSPVDYTPQAGETLVIRRVVPATQETDYPEGGAFPAAAHETALDKLTMLAQQQGEQLGRALQFPVSDPASIPAVLPASSARADRLLGFDQSGAPVAYAAPDASATSVTAAGTTASRLLADRFADVVNVKDFGARGDGIADDGPAIQAAIDAVKGGFGAPVFIPAGTYITNQKIILDDNGIHLFGAGRNSTLIKAGPSFSSETAIFELGKVGGVYGTTLRDLAIDCSNKTGSIGVDLTGVQEGSGLNRVQVVEAVAIGVKLSGALNQQWAMYEIDVAMADNANGIGILVQNTAGHGLIRRGTVVGGLSISGAAGIKLDGASCVRVESVHFERFTHGIHVVGLGTHKLDTVIGHGSLTNVVRLEMPQVLCENINKNGATNALNDTAASPNIVLVDDVVPFHIVNTDVGRQYFGSAVAVPWILNANVQFNGSLSFNGNTIYFLESTFTNGDTSPSVANGRFFAEANAAATNITFFDDGVEGQIITVVFTTANTTIVHNASQIINRSGANVTPAANTTRTYWRWASKWWELS